MASQTIVSTLPPSTPIVRPFSSTAALWVHSHPKSSFLALCALAAGYGLALGCGGLSHDTFVSVATVGGVTLFVSAYVLKRLIFMSEIDHARHLLGLRRNLKEYEMVYFLMDQKIHVATIYRGQELRMDREGFQKFYPTGIQLMTSPDGIVAISLRQFSDCQLQAIVQTINDNTTRTPNQMIQFALGIALPLSSKLKITTDKKTYEVSFEFDFNNKYWSITMPLELCAEWVAALPHNNDTSGKHRLVDATWINDTLVNLLRAAKKELV